MCYYTEKKQVQNKRNTLTDHQIQLHMTVILQTMYRKLRTFHWSVKPGLWQQLLYKKHVFFLVDIPFLMRLQLNNNGIMKLKMKLL